MPNETMTQQVDPNFLLRLAVQYNKLLHRTNEVYKPSVQLDDLLENTFNVFVQSLPSNSKSSDVTEIGSGAGRWTAILSQHFLKVVSIEPRDELISYQLKLLQSLHISNFEIIQDGMPGCIDNIITSSVFFSESLYLSNNWKDTVSKIASNDKIKFVGIVDSVEDAPFNFRHHRGQFFTRIDLESRLPLVENDEFTIKQILENAGFDCCVYNVSTQQKTERPSKDWYLMGVR